MNSDEPTNQQTRKRPLTEIDKPAALMCSVVAIDPYYLCYIVCSVCEKTLPENPATGCKHCSFTNASKRLFRVLVCRDLEQLSEKLLSYEWS